MTSLIRANFIRFILLIIVQFILKEVDYVNIDIYIYPLFILLLPIGMVDGLLILVSFIYGLCIDSFYNTMGLYASAAVAVAAARPIILTFLEPRGGYDKGQSPTKYSLGTRWFMQYSASLIFVHTLWILLFEQLSTFFSLLSMLRLIMIFGLSMLIIVLYQYIFNPKE
jgi:hypothetical protein